MRQSGEAEPVLGGLERDLVVPPAPLLVSLDLLAKLLERRADLLMNLGRGPVLLRPASLDLGALVDRVEPFLGHRPVFQVRELFQEEGAARAHHLVRGLVGREQGEAGTRRPGHRVQPGDPAPFLPDVLPGADQFPGGPVAPLSQLADRPMGDQIQEGLADRFEAEFGGQLDQVGIADGEPFAQRPRQGLGADREGERLFEDREVGIDPRFEGEAAEDARAELVEGADGRRLQPAQDGPPVRRVVARAELVAAGLADPLPELACRLLGERERDDLAQGPTSRPLEVAQEPGRQHGRLPAPRPRAQRDARPADRQRTGLLVGQLRASGRRHDHASRSRLGTWSRRLPDERTWAIRQTAR